jgi:hypothetical protein
MADKNKVGRPVKFDAADMTKALESFISQNDEPLIQEFIMNYNISSSRFYDIAKDNKELKDTIKRAVDKQELYLIKNAQKGLINPTFAIFRLKQKQFGWSDKQEIESTNTNYNIDADYELLKRNATPEEWEHRDELTGKQINDILKR